MKKTVSLLPLFQQFIRESETGKRLKKNGERIKVGSIQNYKYVYHNLESFSHLTEFDLRISEYHRLTKRERASEKNYWKKFYARFTNYLYEKGCYDNYVGQNIKVRGQVVRWPFLP